jgi:ribose 5-phosphate isomerase A
LELKQCDPKVEAAKGLLNEFKHIIESAKIVGIGTGTTISKVLELFATKNVLKNKIVVPSSLDTALKLKNLKVNIALPSTISSIDVYIDGADEVDANGNLIKGGGAALLGEKILASISSYNIIVVDESKVVKNLGKRPIPIEVVPWALSYVMSKLSSMGFKVRVRNCLRGKMGPVISDWGGVIVDVELNNNNILDPLPLERTLKSIPGIVEVGIFIGLTDAVIVGLSKCGYRVLKFERKTKN